MLALRYLRPKRTFVSIITLICIFGVMLGVAVLITVISVMTGFDRELRTRIIGFNPHIRLTTHTNSIVGYQPLVEKLKALPDVKEVAPYVFGQVIIETQNTPQPYTLAVYVRAVNPKLETNMTVLPSSMVSGGYNLGQRKVVIGSGLARGLGVDVGDILAIYSPHDLKRMRDAKQKGEEEGILPEDFEITGIFDVGYYEYNSTFILTSLRDGQDFFDFDDQVHGLMIFLKDPERADLVRMELEKELPGNYAFSTWTEENSTFLDALVVEKSVMFYILFFIMVVAAFGIMSALITFVVQKTREIGMLKALGATSGQIMRVFLGQSLIVGVLGVLSGYGLGLLAVAYRNEFLRFMNKMTGFELFPARIYNFSELPALIVPRDIAIICVASLVICIAAGLFPAWNAGRLKPVEALRHE